MNFSLQDIISKFIPDKPKVRVNLFRDLKQETKVVKNSNMKVIFIVYIVLVFLLTGTYVAIKYNDIKKLDIEINEIETTLSEINFVTAQETIDGIINETNALTGFSNTVDYLGGLMKFPKQFSSELFNNIYSKKSNDIQINKFTYSGDTINILCEARSNIPITGFIRELDNMGIFASVKYQGFYLSQEDIYSFDISAVLLGGVE